MAKSDPDGLMQAAEIAAQVKIDPADAGFRFLPIRAQSPCRGDRSTPFDGLFLGFSYLIMVSAVLLLALLFRLNVEQRAAELGLLGAVGYSRGRLRRMLLGEALVLSILGALLGAGLGLGYAWLMVAGLNTWWVGAISTPFVTLHVSLQSLWIGFAVSVLVALLTIVWSLRGLNQFSVRQLLAADLQSAVAYDAPRRWPAIAATIALLLAAALGVGGLQLGGEAQAGAFSPAGRWRWEAC